ncbi:MAG: 2,3-bisphosphoglycerate-independent phosphoglycerate mutase, partial [Phycisphaerae bacterium]
NAVYLARTPVDDALMATYPHVLIHTSGCDVGLPDGVMGNSEVGHQNIGAGRIVEQEIMRITGRLRDGAFFSNRALVGAFERATQTGGCVHIMGLVSDGRVHSDLEHLEGLLDLSVRLGFPGDRVFVHAFTDGRDTPPRAGIDYIKRINEKCQTLGINEIASVAGRFYAMDRDNRWDRVRAAYDMLTGRCCGLSGGAACPGFASAEAAVAHYYEHPSGDTQGGDEFITPCTTCGAGGGDGGVPRGRITDGDGVIFFNFRGDRPRELVKAFTLETFPFEGVAKDGTRVTMGFDRGRKLDVYFATMTAYEGGLPVEVAFEKPPKMGSIFGAYLGELGLRQFRCAETEKYPHVTFFFNDYRDEPFPGEARRIVPSPRDVATYDLKPEMSAYAVTDFTLERIESGKDDAIVINYANGDMVGHTGSLQAAIKAVEAVDKCVGRVVDMVKARGGALIVTADHGNCEQMIHPDTGGPHTAHTTYDVPLIVVDDTLIGRRLRTGGRLADIAPTALGLMGLDVPDAMTGTSLVVPA